MVMDVDALMSGESHLNWMGGASYRIDDPLVRLRLAASSCFFGEPMYYHRDAKKAGRKVKVAQAYRQRLSKEQVQTLRETLGAIDPQAWRGLSPAELMVQAIDAALAADPEATLAEAARLRQAEHIRTTPQVILVRAANNAAVRGTGLVRRFAKQIILRADEPAVGLAYQLEAYGRPVPNALKKAWRDALERFDAYQLAKYRMTQRAVKTVDVVNMVHPRGAHVDGLVRDTLRLEGRTWESIISAKGSTREAWLAAIEVMGHMALLRNVRNLLKVGLPLDAFVDKLVAGAAKGRQLPFRYYSAYRAVKDEAPERLVEAIEACLEASLGNLPTFQGRVMSLCDNSGSARGAATSSMGTMQIATIGNLTGILTGRRADEGYVVVFGDRLTRIEVSQGSSVLKQLDEIERAGDAVGGGTETGAWLFWDRAIREREHWDHVFVYSDMQAGHGGLYGSDPNAYADFRWFGGRYINVPSLVQHYRDKVNPKVMVYLVQIAGYQDTLIPEFYDRTFVLGGWGDGLLRFAAAMSASLR